MVQLTDIVRVLRRYRDRYRWLDVLVKDVPELKPDAGVEFHHVEGTVYVTEVEGQALQVDLPPGKGVARFELIEDQGVGVGGGALVGAGLGAALGAAVAGADEKGSAPAGAVFGLLVGGLLGAAVGAAAQRPAPPRQVLTLHFDEDANGWRVYHGPYVSWVKGALRAS